MKIEFTPPDNNLDTAGINDYFKKYVQPLGRGRTTVRLVGNELVLESDRPGMLVLAVRLLDLAFGRNWEYILEPMQEWGPGKWYLDMEPGTPEFSIMRHGPPLKSSLTFVYEPPSYSRPTPSLDHLSSLAIGVIGDVEGDHGFWMKLDVDSMISLAKHFVYLSQPEVPTGESLTYKPTFEYDSRASRLRVALTEFSQDVPWAKFPSNKGPTSGSEPKF